MRGSGIAKAEEQRKAEDESGKKQHRERERERDQRERERERESLLLAQENVNLLHSTVMLYSLFKKEQVAPPFPHLFWVVQSNAPAPPPLLLRVPQYLSSFSSPPDFSLSPSFSRCSSS